MRLDVGGKQKMTKHIENKGRGSIPLPLLLLLVPWIFALILLPNAPCRQLYGVIHPQILFWHHDIIRPVVLLHAWLYTISQTRRAVDKHENKKRREGDGDLPSFASCSMKLKNV